MKLISNQKNQTKTPQWTRIITHTQKENNNKILGELQQNALGHQQSVLLPVYLHYYIINQNAVAALSLNEYVPV